ncbi:DUF2971 domain-containing protein [bacterium]|nr:DUF2971 domain-containing protein [bacterium]
MNSEIIYHYTSLEAFKCMFDNYSKENPYLTFWATNCAYMNDPKEISEGIDLIKVAVGPIAMPKPGGGQVILENDKIKETLLITSSVGNIGVPYAMSLSGVKDNINMWRMYGQSGQGIALGFRRDKIKVTGCTLLDCIYGSDYKDGDYEDIVDRIKKMFELFLKKRKTLKPSALSHRQTDFLSTLEIIGKMAPYVKNDAYKYEEEVRLTIHCKTPQFRVINNILTPYTVIQLPMESLELIIIGPDCDERNIDSLKLFFLSKGLDRIVDKFEKSKVPYRN